MTTGIADDMKALEEAVSVAGGWGALASRIGVAASAPGMWRKRGRVPAEHCPAIERETRVACERLNPTVAWDVLRAQAARPRQVRGRASGATDRPSAHPKESKGRA